LEPREKAKSHRVRSSEGGHPTGEAVRVARELRDRIVAGELEPGTPIRQDEIAEAHNVSRIPVREALHILQAEGFVEHKMNAGYRVVQWSVSDLRQLFLMRSLLEKELLQTIRWPTDDELADLTQINKRIGTANQADDLSTLVTLNSQFHMRIFELSPLQLVLFEAKRIWALSEIYRAIYLDNPRLREQVVTDHKQIITALRRHAREQLLDVSEAHRSADQVVRILDVLRNGGRLPGQS
jgi:DNA-binding GntR family transcriptional regulator